MTRPLDAITIGRSSVDLYGVQVGGRLEDMASFRKYIGGSPTNMAAGMSRLGMRAAVITRVGDEHMGRFIREQLVREGVDVRGVRTDPERLTALAILGIRDDRQFPLLFYRENCADMALCEDDIDPNFIAEARCVTVTGTHLSHPRPEAAAVKALEIARRAVPGPRSTSTTARSSGALRVTVRGRAATSRVRPSPQGSSPACTCSTSSSARKRSSTSRAARPIPSRPCAACARCRARCSCASAAPSARWRSKDRSPTASTTASRGPGSPIEVFNVLGAGDGFMAGLLKGWLDGEDWPTTLSTPTPAGRSRCPATAARRPIRVGRSSGSSSDGAYAHPPCATTPSWSTSTGPPTAAATGRRFESSPSTMAPRWSGWRRRRGQSRAHRPVQGTLSRSGAGGRSGASGFRNPLRLATGVGMRSAPRPAVTSGWGARWRFPARPRWSSTSDAIRDRRSRNGPVEHVVTVRCRYHPDDAAQMKAGQEHTIVRLARAARANGLELLLELNASAVGPVEDHTAAEIIQRFHDLGVRPDWWKLEADMERCRLGHDLRDG